MTGPNKIRENCTPLNVMFTENVGSILRKQLFSTAIPASGILDVAVTALSRTISSHFSPYVHVSSAEVLLAYAFVVTVKTTQREDKKPDHINAAPAAAAATTEAKAGQ